MVEDQDVSTLTFFTFDKTGVKQQEVTLPKNIAEDISNMFDELKHRFKSDPLSDETKYLQIEFIDMLDLYGLIPQDLSKEYVLSLLNPPWIKFLQKMLKLSSKTTFLRSPVLNFLNRYVNVNDINMKSKLFEQQDFITKYVLLSNIASSGIGIQLPLFMLPRPRGVAAWAASDAYTYVGSLIQAQGFIAHGTQQALALGFAGVGLSFYLGWLVYALIGYAAFLIINAENIDYVGPPNQAPVISDENPSNGAMNIPISLNELSFRISDFERNRMDYVVSTSPDIGSGSGVNKRDGVYKVPVSGLEGNTKYTWHVVVGDGRDIVEKTFSFTTEMIAPVVSDPLPKDGDSWVPVDISQLSFRLKDFQGDLMDYTVETSPDIGSGGGSDVGNGVYSVDVSGLDGTTEYSWFVNVTDGTYWTREVFSFKTQPFMVFDPFDEGWQYRKKITIDHDLVDGDLSDFPVLVSVFDSDLRDKAQTDGDDILFMDGSGVANRLFHEIELYDDSDGELVTWVKIPDLDGDVDTVLYMYYGNPSCDIQQYPELVWDNNYLAVYHLNENLGNRKDSTSNNLHFNVHSGSPSAMDGKIGNCQDFDGNERLSINNVNLGTTHTISFWLKFDVLTTFDEVIGTSGKEYILTRWDSGGRYIYAHSGGSEVSIETQDINDKTVTGVWYYLTIARDHTSWGGWYVNGTYDTGNFKSGTNDMSYSFLGDVNANPDYTFVGQVDELKVSLVMRSADWISTEYNNQNNPSSFLNFGPEESAP